jgi:hypothetical protein
MNRSLLSIALILSLTSLFIIPALSSPEASAEEDLQPDIPTCGQLAASKCLNYAVNVGPDASSATFALNWRNDASRLEMDLHAPDGKWIRCEKDSTEACKKSNTSLTYLIERPDAGRWLLRIAPENQLASPEDFCICAQLANTKSLDQYDARFSGLFSDESKDEDRDGIDDHIAIEASISVKTAGKYSANGVLENVNNGDKINISNAAFLNIGIHEIRFDLFNLRSTGPYRIEGLSLLDKNGNEIDTFNGNYTTQTYKYDYNESMAYNRSARLTGSYSDCGSDINSDGLFEYLTVDVGVTVYNPGNYSVMGYLYDDDGREVVWSIGSGTLARGSNILHMDFDGKTIERHKLNGTYHLKDLQLIKGDSAIENLSMLDTAMEATITRLYNYSEFVDPVWPEKSLSGDGKGEILLTIRLSSILPVFHGRYSMDIVGANMPPISSNWTVSGSRNGYSYDLPGIHMPDKPNDFSVQAGNVKNLNVGVKKEPAQGSNNVTRTWISTRANAGKDGVARIDNDMISPGIYQFKIFGDAASNATQVALVMEVTKKMLISGKFNLALNTSGFPSGNYSINAKAINGSVGFKEINLAGPSSGF